MTQSPDSSAPFPAIAYGEQLGEAFDLAPVAMILLDSTGVIVSANLRTGSLVGIPPDAMAGNHWSRFAPDPEPKRVEELFRGVLSGAFPAHTRPDYAFKRPDGQTAHFDVIIRSVEDEDHPGLLLVQMLEPGDRVARDSGHGAPDHHETVAALVRSANRAVLATDADGVLTRWNDGVEELTGWPADEVLGRPLADLFYGVGSQTSDLVESTIHGGSVLIFATAVPTASGDFIAVDCEPSRVLDEHGECVGFSCAITRHDPDRADARIRWLNAQQRLIARMRQAIARGANQEELEESILTAVASTTASPQVVIKDRRDDGHTLRLRTSLGFPPGALPVVGEAPEDGLSGRALRTARTQQVDHWSQSTIPGMPASVGVEPESGLVVPVLVGTRVVALIGAYRPQPDAWNLHDIQYVEELARLYADFLGRAEDEAERRRAALHDRLTGLPTMALLLDRLGQALERDRVAAHHTAVVVLDIDHFKFINDTLGHDVGDRLLQSIVPRLQSVIRPGDTIGRLSGDEFVVVVGELGDESSASMVAEDLLEVFVEPFVADGHEHLLSASIGVAVAGPATTPQQLLGDADAATFRAKELGRNRIELFDQTLRERVTARVRTERELRGAVDRGELSLRYQPIIDLRTGFIEGVEALVRWQHPERGLVGPGEFITIAEETGLIVGLGEWVLRTACDQCATWLSDFDLPHPFRLSVNLSTRQLGEQGLCAMVVDALEQSGLPATSLALEVTESVLIEQEDAVEILTALRARGIRIMLDDFGTGYSSLSYLRRFEVDALKIDRSFVSDLGQRRQDALLVSALVQMAGALGIDAVAEGVETAQQAQMLRVLGCGLAQGFHFARPLTTEDATQLLSGGGALPGGKPR